MIDRTKTLTDQDVLEINRGERGIGIAKTLFTEHKLLPTPVDSRTLEVGFGQGELIRYLLETGNRPYGIDVGKASIEGAIEENFIDKCNLIWMDASINRFPYIEDFFDYVFMLETIEHLSSPIHVLFEIKRVLKANGKLVISFPPYEMAGYEGGKHAHVYPGLLAQESFNRMMMQMYFKKMLFKQIGGTTVYVFENIKEVISKASSVRPEETEGQINVFKVVAGNYTEDELYGHLR